MSECDLFIEALQRSDPAERTAYLDRACAGDADLRRRVEILLKADTEASAVLQETAPPDALIAEPAASLPATERTSSDDSSGTLPLTHGFGANPAGTLPLTEGPGEIRPRETKLAFGPDRAAGQTIADGHERASPQATEFASSQDPQEPTEPAAGSGSSAGSGTKLLPTEEQFGPAGTQGWTRGSLFLASEVAGFAEFELLAELGRGGMGVVYKARHRLLNRIVALKMISDGKHASPEVRERFLIEAEAVARLRHPNIVQIYDIGEDDGRPFVTLEMLEGGSLADRLKGTTQPGRAAAELVETLATAMHAAHRGRHHPSRPQAAQRPVRPRRYSQDHRLRPRQTARSRGAAHADGPDHGDTQLHGSRASPGGRPPDRPSRRHLRAGRHPLRDAHRPAAVQGVEPDGDPPPGRLRRRGAALADPAADRTRPRDDLPEVPSKGAVQAVRHRPGAGRGPPPIPRTTTRSAPAGRRSGSGREVGPAAPDDHHADRPGRGGRRDAGHGLWELPGPAPGRRCWLRSSRSPGSVPRSEQDLESAQNRLAQEALGRRPVHPGQTAHRARERSPLRGPPGPGRAGCSSRPRGDSGKRPTRAATASSSASSSIAATRRFSARPGSPASTCRRMSRRPGGGAAALAVFADPGPGDAWTLAPLPRTFSPQEQAEIGDGCYQLLLVLADAVAQPLRRRGPDRSGRPRSAHSRSGAPHCDRSPRRHSTGNGRRVSTRKGDNDGAVRERGRGGRPPPHDGPRPLPGRP